MGNKLSCNCGPLTRKPYRYEDTPWSAGSSSRSLGKRDGHLLRLWAEVFHVTTAGGGAIKWQQVSEDLVPVNITCVQDAPELIYHITAYNSQVDKILDVRLVQPGTRIGQASECFVYWKDPVTSDTWGLNFTSPIDAKQFRECCSFKFSRKASSSYSLKLDNNARGGGGRGGTMSGTASRGGSGRINATSSTAGRRRPLSTPTSPSKSREPQCTCMTAEQYARLRAMDPRFRAASTLPRSTPNQPVREGSTRDKGQGSGADNYATIRRPMEKGVSTDLGDGDDVRGHDRMRDGVGRSGRGSTRGGHGGREIVTSKSVDYSDGEMPPGPGGGRGAGRGGGGGDGSSDTMDRKKSRSKSTDDVTERMIGGPPGSRKGGLMTQQQQTEAHQAAIYSRSRTLPSRSTIGTNTTPTGDGLTDSQTLKRLLKPMPSTTGSVVTSPEMSRRIYHPHQDGYISEPEIRHVSTHTAPGKRPTDALRRLHDHRGIGVKLGRGVGTQTGYKLKSDISPPTDHPMFDHACYATTPPSSSPDEGGHGSPSPGSPTARLLLEYEQHLRNTLAKGMDAESYSLHTFEAIISQSNENLAAPPNSRSTTLPRLGAPSREHFRTSREVSRESRDSDVLSGYYSDFRDRGYLSDHNSRSSGYFGDGLKTSGYFSDRERSGYFSDREGHLHHKYNSVRQQVSIESADSRLCYLTSSEGKSSGQGLSIPTTSGSTSVGERLATNTTPLTTTSIKPRVPPKPKLGFSTSPRPPPRGSSILSSSATSSPSTSGGGGTSSTLPKAKCEEKVAHLSVGHVESGERGSGGGLATTSGGDSEEGSYEEAQKKISTKQSGRPLSASTGTLNTPTTTTANQPFSTFLSPSGGSATTPSSPANSTSTSPLPGSKSPSAGIKFIITIPPSQTYLPKGLDTLARAPLSSTTTVTEADADTAEHKPKHTTTITTTYILKSPSSSSAASAQVGSHSHQAQVKVKANEGQGQQQQLSLTTPLLLPALSPASTTGASVGESERASERNLGDYSDSSGGRSHSGESSSSSESSDDEQEDLQHRLLRKEKVGTNNSTATNTTTTTASTCKPAKPNHPNVSGNNNKQIVSGTAKHSSSSSVTSTNTNTTAPSSKASFASTLSGTRGPPPPKTQAQSQPPLQGPHPHPNYDSIQELYSFVSDVLSSWEASPLAQQQRLIAKAAASVSASSAAAIATSSLGGPGPSGSGGSGRGTTQKQLNAQAQLAQNLKHIQNLQQLQQNLQVLQKSQAHKPFPGNAGVNVVYAKPNKPNARNQQPLQQQQLQDQRLHPIQKGQQVGHQQQVLTPQQQQAQYQGQQQLLQYQALLRHQQLLHYHAQQQQQLKQKQQQQPQQQQQPFKQPQQQGSPKRGSAGGGKPQGGPKAPPAVGSSHTLPHQHHPSYPHYQNLTDHHRTTLERTSSGGGSSVGTSAGGGAGGGQQVVYRPTLPYAGAHPSLIDDNVSRSHPTTPKSTAKASTLGSGKKGKQQLQAFPFPPTHCQTCLITTAAILQSGSGGGGGGGTPATIGSGISTGGGGGGGGSGSAKSNSVVSGVSATVGQQRPTMVTAGQGPITTSAGSAFYSPQQAQAQAQVQRQLQLHQQQQHQRLLQQQQQQIQAHYQNPSHLRFPQQQQQQKGPLPPSTSSGGVASATQYPQHGQVSHPQQPSTSSASFTTGTKYATFQQPYPQSSQHQQTSTNVTNSSSDIYANAYANPLYDPSQSAGAGVHSHPALQYGSAHASAFQSTSSNALAGPLVQYHPESQSYFTYNPALHPLQQQHYANFYQAAPSLTGHEEPISRPVSGLSNRSGSEQYYTYPYQRKQQEQIFKPIDWCTLVHWARKVVQTRDEDNEIKTDCSHGTHEINGLKRHEHQHSWPHVATHECNVLFLAKVMQRISDDERMSLTTAVSDDEPGDGTTSPKGSRKPAASFNCTGAVRKAGFLSVKKWLLRKRHQVELARRRGWKGYWVCLKGTTLLFYPCDAREARSVEAAPKHLIIVDGAIMQPIPEHPKRDYIFCLSTAFGDAYLFQAPCQVELESWVHSIHWACAAAFARHRGKTGTLHLLQEEIIRLDKSIESDGKLRHMAELQRSVVADPETRQQLAQQISNWEENIERLHCEQFRLRCYMASLQGGELPNPKSLLSHVSRTTKNTLNRLGVFTVSSFHAFVCARSPSLLSNLLAGRGATKRRAPLLSRSNSASSRRSLHVSSDRETEIRTAKISLPDNQVVTVPLKESMTVEDFLVTACTRKGLAHMEHFVRVKKRRELPDTNYFVPHRNDLIETYLSTHEVVEVRAKLLYQVELQRASLDQMWGFSVEAELCENADRQDELCCFVSRVEDRSVAMNNEKRGRGRKQHSSTTTTPTTNGCGGEICQIVVSVTPSSPPTSTISNRGKFRGIYPSRERQTPEGIIKGDEILVINGAIVSDLDMMYIESVLQEELSLCLMLRSSRTEPPALAAALAAADAAIAQLVCPPPPADPDVLTEAALSNLIVPAPHDNKDLSPSDTDEIVAGSRDNMGVSGATDIDALIKTAGEITGFCRTKEGLIVGGRSGSTESGGSTSTTGRRPHPQLVHQVSIGTDSPITGGASPTHTPSSGHLGPSGLGTRDVEKMKKAVHELVDTERAYVKHLTCLLEQYLEPLRHENFLSATEMMAIFGNIREMVGVQRRFLRSLEAAMESGPSPSILDIIHPSEFKNILLNISSAFLSFADHFKLYSSFCASHSKAQKLLHPVEGNQALQQFLSARNPKQQHANTLESYLIKPIQRILKYPLLLQQIRNLCDTSSEEYRTLVESLQCMERVAEHINEMQRIHEEYGAIFEHLQRQHQKASKTPIDLSPGDLLHYGGVEWLNIADFLGKIKKGLELHAMCFVFKSAVVFLCKERLRHKKKLISSSTSKASDKSEVEIIRYQVLIPVSEVQVRQVGEPKDNDGPNYSWELTHLRCSGPPRRTEKTYLLSNSTAEFRNVFLRNIRQIIRESVRNMSLPPRLPDGGPPPPPNGEGGGGSRSHYATPEGIESVEGGRSNGHGGHSSGSGGGNSRHHGQAHTLGRKKPPKPPQRHSAGNIEMGSVQLKHQDSTESQDRSFRGRSRTVGSDKGDPEEGGSGHHHPSSSRATTMPRAKGVLGNTPNHLTLSTTSTLSAGSTGSAAKLIQASATPGKNIPVPQPAVPEPSSPIWKPREGGFDTLPKKSEEAGTSAAATTSSSVVTTVTTTATISAPPPSSSKDSSNAPGRTPPTKTDTMARPSR